jgi:hypothetical protein
MHFEGESMFRALAFLPLLVLALPVARAESPAPAKSPPSSWSEEGYQQLRFGMGTGDVEEVLRKGEGPLYLEKDKGLDTQTPMPGITLATPGYTSVNVAGRKASAVVLGFWQGGLYLVAIVLSAGDKDPGSAEWFKEASRLLTLKYGAPGPCGKDECNWKKGDLGVHLGISAEAGDAIGGLEYKSVSRSAKVDAAIEAVKKGAGDATKDL